MVPKWSPKKEDYDYGQPPFEVRFAETKGGEANIDAGQCYHYRTLGESMRKYVARYLEQECFDISELKRNYWDRLPVNLRFYLRVVADAHPLRPFHPKASGLLDSTAGIGRAEPIDDRYRLFFVTGADYSFNVAMNNEGAEDRLISYVKIMGRTDLAYFMKFGHFTPVYNSAPVQQRVRIW